MASPRRIALRVNLPHTDRNPELPGNEIENRALLGRGFDASPSTLLASMNIRLDDPALVKSASRLFQAKTEELQSLYQAEPALAK